MDSAVPSSLFVQVQGQEGYCREEDDLSVSSSEEDDTDVTS